MRYSWERFWCQRGQTYSLSDGGYLPNPTEPWSHIIHPNVIAFERIEHVPCLVLLGEPGIGKSDVAREVVGAQQGSALHSASRREDDRPAAALSFDLRMFSSDGVLRERVFQNAALLAWKQDDQRRLTVVLDSLDECGLSLNTLVGLLADELQQLPIERLDLRVLCRTAEWPASFEETLRSLWGADHVSAYELLPLRRVDVDMAAKASGIDATAFLAAVAHAEAVPLAIKPLTLRFLLNRFRVDEHLPSTQTEIYADGCRLLAEEPNTLRRRDLPPSALSADERLAVAARIAAITIFAQRSAIWRDLDYGDVPVGDVTVRELQHVSSSDARLSGSAAVREVLGTGLFTARGEQELGWAHQTYAEYLAARFAVEHNFALPQILALVTHPDDASSRLVPQLYGTAAWLASMRPDVFRAIMRVEPDVLLRSDVSTATAYDRAALVEALLSLYESEQVLDGGREHHGRYAKLAHPDLATQLRLYIANRQKRLLVRRVAIDIAERCNEQALVPDLLARALDTTDNYYVRVAATYAIGRIGDALSKAALKPLISTDDDEDPDDELKGASLKALWPDQISAEELFGVLTPRRNEHLVGAYDVFLMGDIAARIRPDDLPVALAWAEKQAAFRRTHPFRKLVDGILTRAWQNLAVSDVANGFAQVALTRLRHHDEIIGAEEDDADSTEAHTTGDARRGENTQARLSDVAAGVDAHVARTGVSERASLGREMRHDTARRRTVLAAILARLAQAPSTDYPPYMLLYSRPPLVSCDDLLWLLGRLDVASDLAQSQVLAELVAEIARITDFTAGQADGLIGSCGRHVVLAELCSGLLNAVRLDSPEAERARAAYWAVRDPQAQGRLDTPAGSVGPERVEHLLGMIAAGDSFQWWLLSLVLTLESDGTPTGDELVPDIRALAGWKAADIATQERMVEAARRYVLEHDPNPSEWLGKNVVYWPAMAGYKALLLLQRERPAVLAALPAEVWRRWAPVLVGSPISRGLDEDRPHDVLVALAYRSAGPEMGEALRSALAEAREQDHIFAMRAVEACWDSRFDGVLMAFARDESIKLTAFADVLIFLLEHGSTEARWYATSLLALPISADAACRTRAKIAACTLLSYPDAETWRAIWPVLERDPSFGEEVMLSLQSGPFTEERLATALVEGQMADLYLWLDERFPSVPAPERKAGFMSEVTPQQRLTEWRTRLVAHLASRATPDACDALRRLTLERPDQTWLRWKLLEAEHLARQHTWRPLAPADILALAQDKRRRLVRNGEQLLDVLEEALQRLQEKLQGETPSAIDLWNENASSSGTVYRPKDENRFSDYVKRYLEEELTDHGIVVNREVEIRRGSGTTGQRTDLHVNAVLRGQQADGYDVLTAIIEAKGSWHKELLVAMKTQLVDRYLTESGCSYGLYLVGWFNCRQWDANDRRRQQAETLKMTPGDAQTFFATQAHDLSIHGLSIRAAVLNTALS